MAQHIPSLPAFGPLRLLVISASLSLLAFVSSAVGLFVRGKKPASGWAAAPCGMSLVSFGLGRFGSALHPIASLASALLAARNVVRFEGAARALQAFGLVSWLVAMIAARALFVR